MQTFLLQAVLFENIFTSKSAGNRLAVFFALLLDDAASQSLAKSLSSSVWGHRSVQDCSFLFVYKVARRKVSGISTSS